MGAGGGIRQALMAASDEVPALAAKAKASISDALKAASDELPIRDQFDLVRFDPPKGQPKRLDEVLTEDNAQRLMGIARRGIAKGGDDWYNTRAIHDQFVAELGEKEGTHQFGRFMDFVAATSPRSKVDQNIRRASYFHHLERQGRPFAGLTNKDMPKGYGHLAHETQNKLLQDLDGGKHFEMLSRPKTSSFAENLKGNWRPVTVDTHNMRSVFDNPKLSRSPYDTEYRYLEAFEQDIAARLGIEPAQFQSALWVADDTGVANTKNFTELFDEAVARTAAQNEIPKGEALKRFIRGEIPLYSLLAGTTLGQFLAPQEAEAGALSAADDVVKRLGKSIEGWHFSKSDEALRRLDPDKYATGASKRQGAEKARLGSNPDIAPRSFFYTDDYSPQPGRRTPRPEGMVGAGPTYRAKLDKIYDLGENPLGLKGNATDIERQVKELGFNGYTRNNVVVDFYPTEVERIGPFRAQAEENLARAEGLVDEPQLVTAEVVPSTQTEMGRYLSEKPMSVREEYTDRFGDMLEQEKILPGLGVDSYSITPGYGTYKGDLNPNLVIATNTEDEAKAVADALGYGAQQEAVPYINRAGAGPIGVKATFPAGRHPGLLEDMYQATGVDATRTKLDVVDAINFNEMPDDEFADTIARFLRDNGTDNVKSYRAGGSYNETSALWQGDDSLAGVRPGQRETLRRLRKRVEEDNRRFRKEHGRSDPRLLAAIAAITASLTPDKKPLAQEAVEASPVLTAAAGLLSDLPWGGPDKDATPLERMRDAGLETPVKGLYGLLSGDPSKVDQDPWDTGEEAGEWLRGESNSPMVNAGAEALKWFTRFFGPV